MSESRPGQYPHPVLSGPYLSYRIAAAYRDFCIADPTIPQSEIEAMTGTVERLEVAVRADDGSPFGRQGEDATSRRVTEQLFPFLDGAPSLIRTEDMQALGEYLNSLAARRNESSRDSHATDDNYGGMQADDISERMDQRLLERLNRDVAFMRVNAGSVDAYFRDFDGTACFDPDALFGDAITSMMPEYRRARIAIVRDMKQRVTTAPPPLPANPLKYARKFLGAFLGELGLEDVPPHTLIEPGIASQSDVIYIGPSLQPSGYEPYAYMRINPAGQNLYTFERLLAHEGGHVAQRRCSGIENPGAADMAPGLDELPSKLFELFFCSEAGARIYNYDHRARAAHSAWYHHDGFVSLLSNIRLLEFSYRIYKTIEADQARSVATSSDTLDGIFAEIQQKYGLASYPTGGDTIPRDRTWREEVCHRFVSVSRPFGLREYVIGHTAAELTRRRLSEEDIRFGEPGFAASFSHFYRQTFCHGPWLRLANVEQALGFETIKEIPRQLHVGMRRVISEASRIT